MYLFFLSILYQPFLGYRTVPEITELTRVNCSLRKQTDEACECHCLYLVLHPGLLLLAMGDCKNHLCVIFQTSNNHILCEGETVPAFVREAAKGQWPPPFTLSLLSALALWVITRSRKPGGHRGFISPLECAQMVGITANEVLKQINNYQVEFWGYFCPSNMAGRQSVRALAVLCEPVLWCSPERLTVSCHRIDRSRPPLFWVMH